MAPRDWSGHWHGYGPWIGTRDQLGQEHLRVPSHPDFLTNTMPPVMTAHALLRRSQTAAALTWTDVSQAMEWLRKIYAGQPPTGDYLPLEKMAEYAEYHLSIGQDAVWAWYNGRNVVSSSVICCPHFLERHIPCPLPPK